MADIKICKSEYMDPPKSSEDWVDVLGYMPCLILQMISLAMVVGLLLKVYFVIVQGSCRSFRADDYYISYDRIGF